MSLASTEWAAGREPEKKRSENMLVYHDMQESHAARLCMEKIDLLCVTAVSNGNVELKVGVLPVHSARTVPTIGLFPILCLGIACSLKDGLPSSTMEKTKKKKASVFKIWLAGAASSRPADIQSSPPPFIQTCVTGSAGRQWFENVLFVLEDRTLFFFAV